MNLTLHIWRQADAKSQGALKTYQLSNMSPDTSFLEMIDLLNIQLVEKGEEPVSYDCDCLEGICGACSLVINGVPHGPETGITTCQLHLRSFKDGDHITIEPWRASAFPLIKDLVVDRAAFERIIRAGGFISANAGGAPDANSVPIGKTEADIAMDAAQCIGCGACVAACKNGSAMLFVAAKVGHLAHLPQGQPERYRRAKAMVEAMEKEGFGSCTNQYECEAVCPKSISRKFIAELNRDYRAACLRAE